MHSTRCSLSHFLRLSQFLVPLSRKTKHGSRLWRGQRPDWLLRLWLWKVEDFLSAVAVEKHAKRLKKVKNQNGDWGNGLWPSCNPVSAVSFFHQHFGPRTSFLDIWTGRGRAAEWPGMAPQQLSGFQKASWNQQMARPGNSLAAGSRVWRDSP